jgi:sorting nexin-4
LHRLVGYAQSVKDTLKTREQKQIDHESLSDYLATLNLEREKLSKPGSRAGSTSNLTAFIKDKYDEMKGTDPERIRQDRLIKNEHKIAEVDGA